MNVKELKNNAKRFAQMDIPMPQDMCTTKWQQGRYEGYIEGFGVSSAMVINKACEMFENYIRSGSCTDDYVKREVKKFRSILER